jgi:hypothetical protein
LKLGAQFHADQVNNHPNATFNSNNSLLGTLRNGANNYLLGTPRYLPGPQIPGRSGDWSARSSVPLDELV